jgi:hypothetical protein
VARDNEFVYFYVRTCKPISPRSSSNWMTLFIDVDGDPSNGWEGYDYIVNRRNANSTTILLEKNAGGWSWVKSAEAVYLVKGNEMQIAIPRSALGLPTGKDNLTFDFKWTDNIQHPDDVMDFYLSGGLAPDGRFRYRYTTK